MSGPSVTITGSSFTSATEVDFGGIAVSPTVNSDTQITVAAPTVSYPQTVDVTVTTLNGTSAINQPGDQFTFKMHPPPGQRLRGGMYFSQNTLQPLDTCEP
jgi:hypothetical protein